MERGTLLELPENDEMTRLFIQCECGCGGTTRGGRFMPGHDQRLYGQLIRVIDENGSTSYDGAVAMQELRRLGWDQKYLNRGQRRANVRRFGVEIEFYCSSKYDLAEALAAAGIVVQIEGYNHNTRSHWKLITDGSLNSVGRGQGCELVSPPLAGAEGFRQLETVCRVMEEQNCKVDRTTGLHVHHEVRDMDVAGILRLVDNYANSQESIDAIMAPSRRSTGHNHYCSPVRVGEYDNLSYYSTLREARSAMQVMSRYKTINLTSYPKYGTVEFRQHGGTINYSKIYNWVRFGQQLIELAKNPQEVSIGSHRNVWLLPEQISYYNSREQQFAALAA